MVPYGGSKSVKLRVPAKVNSSGTLNRFTIIVNGKLSKSNDGIWNFKGSGTVDDIYDFNLRVMNSDGEMILRDDGTLIPTFLGGILNGAGNPFPISSESFQINASLSYPFSNPFGTNFISEGSIR